MMTVIRVAVLALATIGIAACLPTFEDNHTTTAPVPVAAYVEIPTPFAHAWTEPSHPFTGAAVIDIDGEGNLEIFVGGGRGQADMVLGFKDGALADRTAGTGLASVKPATHGAASIDMNDDGWVDLLVAREDGLTLYVNNGGTFSAQPIPLTLQPDAVPMSIAVSDMDGDSDGDLYVSVFVTFPAFKSATFNDPAHAKANVVLRNDGGLKFTDVTKASGAMGTQNTFHATFANLDGDADQDLVLSQNTGEIEIFENKGGGTFTPVPTNSGYGFWMGLAVGDVDQDGDADIFASNIGTSIPDFLTSGDLRADQRQNSNWILMRNDGNLAFSDVTESLNLTGYGFSWGAQFEDLNLDGRIDLLVAQNYIKWPPHKIAPLPGKALLQLDAPEGRGFYQVPGLGLDNPLFGQSPIIVDLDGDGRADVLWLNMNGPLRAFLNRGAGSYLTVRLPDNVAALGATVCVTTTDGRKRSRQVIASTGLMTDPTPHVHFGLGAATGVETVEVITMDGRRTAIARPGINRAVTVSLP